MMRFLCCDERRRTLLAGRSDYNGIAALEVDSGPDGVGATLRLSFLNATPLPVLTADNIVIGGGAVIRTIGVAGVEETPGAGGEPPQLTIVTESKGDYSIYQLTLVSASDTSQPPPGLDPILSAIDFTFYPGADSDFDFTTPAPCPPEPKLAPPIDYLSRDFNSLRQLMLDRMAVLRAPLPGGEPVDLGVTLVELLAYVGDQLSYRQDAIATESALHTARQRISARRHARLVDYTMHNGCNARAWIVLTMAPNGATSLPGGTRFLSSVPALQGTARTTEGSDAYVAALAQGAQVFESLGGPLELDARLDGIRFHDWGGLGCCLPKGATSATLAGDLSGLIAPGRVLVLREMMDAQNGDPALADPAHRCAVRLVSVVAGSDPLGGALADPPTDDPLPVTEVVWADEDALPFALCISTEGDPASGTKALSDVSLAFGNVILADHGRSVGPEALGSVPSSGLVALASPSAPDSLTDAEVDESCGGTATIEIPPRFNPVLAQGPLTHAVDYAPAPGDSAASLTATDAATAVPEIILQSDGPAGTTDWTAESDIIGAGTTAVYVVEVDNALRGALRFGDGVDGRAPTSGAAFTASYRIGNGSAGNVGAGNIACIVSSDTNIAGATNPMPAGGGVDAETVDEVRRRAPAAFYQQERAVVAQDYADQAQTYSGVLHASTVRRWTGSWPTYMVAVDRTHGRLLDETFIEGLGTALDRVRMAGSDLQIVDPLDVPVELALSVEVADGHFRSLVRQALLMLLTSAPGGLFDPDRFTFGQTFYLSPILAAVQSTPGVQSVTVATFQRLGQPATDARDSGGLAMAPSEIARLDNDPNYPDRGVLRLSLGGGR